MLLNFHWSKNIVISLLLACTKITGQHEQVLCQHFHVVRDDIMGHYFGMILRYFGMKIYDDNNFFSVCQLKKKILNFHSQKIYNNIMPN